MKHMKLLIWLTQLGLSVAAPPAGFLLLGVWLHSSCGWGKWTIFAGLIFGISGAVSGLRSSLQILGAMAGDRDDHTPPAISFNEHD